MYDNEFDGAGHDRRRRFDDDEPHFLKRSFLSGPDLTDDEDDRPEDGDRWSTWDLSTAGERGPRPYPDWLVTELAAVDIELGIVKTGKEADVFLVRRAVPDTDRQCLLAAKRYRSAKHRMFHRDAGYLEVIAGQWAAAEFGALYRLWEVGTELGVRIVPYPVQILGTELLLEFLGTDDGQAAPRLAQVRPDAHELEDLWDQLVTALTVLARCQIAHGDLSAYNILVRDGRLVLIDLPQVVDVVSNPHGARFVHRDVHNVAGWFTARGLTGIDVEELTRELLRESGVP